MTGSSVRRSARWIGVLALAIAGCGGEDPTGPVATTSVEVRDNSFSPRHIVVGAGATVTWTWTGSSVHSVNFASASITDSPDLSSGTHITAMPVAVGTYPYSCDFHASMTGTVTVQ